MHYNVITLGFRNSVDHYAVTAALEEEITEDMNRISPRNPLYYISIRTTGKGQKV
jgi:hypothetical protein